MGLKRKRSASRRSKTTKRKRSGRAAGKKSGAPSRSAWLTVVVEDGPTTGDEMVYATRDASLKKKGKADDHKGR